MSYYLVITTVAKPSDAERLANQALELRLAACVQVQAASTSFYEWQGKNETATEHPLHFKTNQLRKDELIKFIKDHHPYDLPEIIAIEIQGIDVDYAKWLDAQTSRND